MARALKAKRHQTKDHEDAVEFFFERGWSDGLPVVPPTEQRVRQFLDYVGLEPDAVLGDVPERARVITAEQAAINAVMAGCKPEYMPVVVAIVEAMTDPKYKFNHLASLGSPWPMFVVNGPIIKQLDMHTGIYPFGPGSRPNLTISRSISLLMRNCAEAKAEGIQRGQWGNPTRLVGCIAENEDTTWTPLHVMRGFEHEQSVVTVTSVYPGTPYHAAVLLDDAKNMLETVCYSIPNCAGAQWSPGTYTVLVGPHHVELFQREGWSKEKVRQHILDNAKISVAALKARRTWGVRWGGFTEDMLKIEPGDDSKYMYLFKDNGENQHYLGRRSNFEGREFEVFVVVCGGNAGFRIAIAPPYAASTNPVSKVIKGR